MNTKGISSKNKPISQSVKLATTLKTFIHNTSSQIADTDINREKKQRKEVIIKCNTIQDKSRKNIIKDTYLDYYNNPSFHFSIVKNTPLTYTQNCSKELLLVNPLSKNNSLSPNNYIINQRAVLSLLNVAKKRCCYLCRSASTKLINSLTCSHLFCDTCIQLLINNEFLIKENDFKCPIIQCNSLFDKEVLKIFFLSKDSLSEKSKTIETNSIHNQENKDKGNQTQSETHNNNINIKETNIRVYNRSTKQTKGQSTKCNTHAFLFFMKNKGRYCRNCCSDKLYSPIDKLIFVCLNCLKRVCQKCYRYCDDETHFDMKYVNHCPILDSKRRKERNKTTCQDILRSFAFEFIGLVIGFIVLITGQAINIKLLIFSLCHKKKKSKGRSLAICLLNILLYMLVGVLSCIWVFIGIFLLPYYSAIVLLYDSINDLCHIN